MRFAPDNLSALEEVDSELEERYTRQQSKPTAAWQWERPLPPAPGNRMDDRRGCQEHHKYCDYYKLMKKNMHKHLSVSLVVNYTLKP